jgi:Rps23 Pro-64 3,4-dihydroxylase Tpa1-like proline 4-hydroxylase
MKFEHMPTPDLPVMIIEDRFTNEQRDLMYQELSLLNRPEIMLPPADSGSATDADGNPTKSNHAAFLHNVYKDQQLSPIVQNVSDIWTNEYVLWELTGMNKLYNSFSQVNYQGVLVSYYEQGDEYPTHQDSSLFTVLNYLWYEPKGFKGGNLVLWIDEENGAEIELSNNSTVIMPGFQPHAVTPIDMVAGPTQSNMGRFCITQFGYIVPE